MKKSLIVNIHAKSILNKKVVWLKKYGEMFHSKNIQTEKSYGDGSDMDKFAKEKKRKGCLAEFIGFASRLIQQHMLTPSFIPFYTSVSLLFLILSMLRHLAREISLYQ